METASPTVGAPINNGGADVLAEGIANADPGDIFGDGVETETLESTASATAALLADLSLGPDHDISNLAWMTDGHNGSERAYTSDRHAFETATSAPSASSDASHSYSDSFSDDARGVGALSLPGGKVWIQRPSTVATAAAAPQSAGITGMTRRVLPSPTRAASSASNAPARANFNLSSFELGDAETAIERETLSTQINSMPLWRTAPSARSSMLARVLLDTERPQLNNAMIEHWLSDDAHLSALLDFIVRPVDSRVHAGAGPVGQDAVAAVSSGLIPSLPSPPTDFDLAMRRLNRDHASTMGDNQQPGDSSASGDAIDTSVDLSSYGVVDFAFDSVSDGKTGAAAGAGAPPLASAASTPLRQRISSFGGASTADNASMMLEDLDMDVSGDIHSGLLLSDSHGPGGHHHLIGAHGGGAGAAGSGSESAAIAQAVSAAHAAAFAAAVADLAGNVSRVYHSSSAVIGGNNSNSGGFPSRSRSSSTGGSDGSPSRSAAADRAGSTVRPVSLLFPRGTEETDALASLAARIDAVQQHRVARMDREQEASSSPSSAMGSEDAAVTAVLAGVASLELPPPYHLRSAANVESLAVKRGYRLTRMLCGGTTGADDLMSSRVDDIAKHMFSVFSSRYKGSFHHACSVLQRLVQFQPDALARTIASDSQRYIGAMMNYVHHAPVADTLVQIVLLSHLQSAFGGAGAIATINPSITSAQSGVAGLGGLGMGMSGLLGFGGMHGRAGAGGTNYEGPLQMYSTKGVNASHASRTALYKSLAGWGFLSVLASHVYRPEYAVCPDHVINAGGAWGVIIKHFSTDSHAEVLLQPLTSSPGLLLGLVTAAVAPRPGCDFPATPTAATVSATTGAASPPDGYCASGEVPVRQRVSMKLLSELAALSFLDHVPAPQEPGTGAQPQVGVPQRMVDNRLAKHSQAIAAALVASLPRLAAALIRVHKCLHPEVSTIPVKAKGAAVAKPKQAGDAATGAAPASGSAEGGAAGGASEKKKKKKKKKKSKASAGAGASNPTGSPDGKDSGATAGGGEHDSDSGDDHDGGDDTPATAAGSEAGGKGTTPALGATASPSADEHGVPKLHLDLTGVNPAPSASAGVPGATFGATPAAPPTPPKRQYRHPGHVYTSQFGSYRTAAMHTIALLVARDGASIPKQEAWPVPPTQVPQHGPGSSAAAGGAGISRTMSLHSQSAASQSASGAASVADTGLGDDSASGLGSPASRSRASTAVGADAAGASPSVHNLASTGGGLASSSSAAAGRKGKDGGGHAHTNHPHADERLDSDEEHDDREHDGDDDDDHSGGDGEEHEDGGESVATSRSGKSKSSSKGKGGGKGKGKGGKGGKGGTKKNTGRKSTGSVDSSTTGAGRDRSGSSDHDDGSSGASTSALAKWRGKAKGAGARLGLGGSGISIDEPEIEMVKVSTATLEALSAPALLAGVHRWSATGTSRQPGAGFSSSIVMHSSSGHHHGHGKHGKGTSHHGHDSAGAGIASPSSSHGGHGAALHSPGLAKDSDSHDAHHQHPQYPSTADILSVVSWSVHGSTATGLPYLVHPGTGTPLTYDPLDFWGVTGTWVTLYSHTNLYHTSFFNILKGCLKANHEASLGHLLKGSKLVSSFIHHYQESAPRPPPIGTSATREAGLITAEEHEAIQARRPDTPKRRVNSTKGSGARGTILRSLNAIRLAASALPPTSFLASHLRDHTLWLDYQPTLKAETAITLKPLVPVPVKPAAKDAETMSSLSALQNFLAPSTYAALLGQAGLNLLGGGKGKADAKKPEKSAEEEIEADLSLGSAFAKELGFEGVQRYVDPLVAAALAKEKAEKEAAEARSKHGGKGHGKAAAKASVTATSPSPAPSPPAGRSASPAASSVLSLMEDSDLDKAKAKQRKAAATGSSKKDDDAKPTLISSALDAFDVNSDLLDVD